jgi:hypothetical protein
MTKRYFLIFILALLAVGVGGYGVLDHRLGGPVSEVEVDQTVSAEISHRSAA